MISAQRSVAFSALGEQSLTLFHRGGGGEGPGGRPGDSGRGAPGHGAAHDERSHHDIHEQLRGLRKIS